MGSVPGATHTFFFAGPFDFDAVLSTKAKRNSWEKVTETIVLPQLEVSGEGSRRPAALAEDARWGFPGQPGRSAGAPGGRLLQPAAKLGPSWAGPRPPARLRPAGESGGDAAGGPERAGRSLLSGRL